jgi:hypothetical protein
MARIRPPRFSEPGRLPETAVVVVTGTNPDGDPIARPATWEALGSAAADIDASRRATISRRLRRATACWRG